MNFDIIDIRELLPQQEPFVMVGKLTYCDQRNTVTQTEILADNIFVDEGVFTASGIIENIAQTCAARIGYVNKYILGKGVQLGFIGAIRNLTLYRYPKVGDLIETTVEVIEEIFGMTLVSATVTIGQEVLAETQMKIALSEEKSQNR